MLVFRPERVDRLSNRIREGFHQPYLRLCRALMVDFEALPMGDDRGPDIVIGEPAPHFPRLAQEMDCPIWRYPANEVEAPGGEGHHPGERFALGSSQAVALDAPVGLRRGAPVQGGGSIRVPIPLQEMGAFAADVRKRAEVVAVPEATRPQPREAFDHAVALSTTLLIKIATAVAVGVDC